MALGPDDGARLASDMTDVVAEAELALLKRVTDRLKTGADAPDWMEQKLAELTALQRSLSRIAARMESDLTAGSVQTVNRAYDLGVDDALEDLAEAGRPVRTTTQRGALTQIARDTASKMTGVAPVVLRSLSDAYQAAVAPSVASVRLGAETRRQAAQSALNTLLGDGITGFRDRAGRNWRLESYVEMAVRTGSGQAAMAGHTATLTASGQDLIQVIPGPRACPLCDRWAGRVLSISGNPVPGITDGSLSDAEGSGWRHPNCRCTTGIYIPGVTSAEVTRPDPEGYEASQRQRYLERKVRNAKRREVLALDDASSQAARRKVREAQAEIRAHLSAHPDLRRLPYREQIKSAI